VSCKWQPTEADGQCMQCAEVHVGAETHHVKVGRFLQVAANTKRTVNACDRSKRYCCKHHEDAGIC
jgi:hypothetical protein